MRIPVNIGTKSRPAPELHKPHAPLQQPASQQTGPSEVGAVFLIHAVKRQRGRGLLRQVGGLRHRELHPRGQLIASHTTLDGVVLTSLREIAAIELRYGSIPGCLRFTRQGRRRNKVADWRAAGIQHHSLMTRGQKAARPVVGSSRGKRPAVG
jgi:hypothetical protein